MGQTTCLYLSGHKLKWLLQDVFWVLFEESVKARQRPGTGVKDDSKNFQAPISLKSSGVLEGGNAWIFFTGFQHHNPLQFYEMALKTFPKIPSCFPACKARIRMQ